MDEMLHLCKDVSSTTAVKPLCTNDHLFSTVVNYIVFSNLRQLLLVYFGGDGKVYFFTFFSELLIPVL